MVESLGIKAAKFTRRKKIQPSISRCDGMSGRPYCRGGKETSLRDILLVFYLNRRVLYCEEMSKVPKSRHRRAGKLRGVKGEGRGQG